MSHTHRKRRRDDGGMVEEKSTAPPKSHQQQRKGFLDLENHCVFGQEPKSSGFAAKKRSSALSHSFSCKRPKNNLNDQKAAALAQNSKDGEVKASSREDSSREPATVREQERAEPTESVESKNSSDDETSTEKSRKLPDSPSSHAQPGIFANLEDYFVFDEIERTEDIREKYDIGKEFSRGARGRVYSAIERSSGELRAVKTIQKPRFVHAHERRTFFHFTTSEAKLLGKIDHPNVVKLFDVFEDERRIYLVMEMCSGGELFDKIATCRGGGFPEEDAARSLRQVIEAVAHIHERKVAHCDLNPANMVFATQDRGSPLKLVDFSHSHVLRPDESLRTVCGTPYYVAPEVLEGKFDEACDMWSIGVTLFCMIYGYPPFHALSTREVYRKIAKGFTPKVLPNYGPWFPIAMRASDRVKDLISRLLVTDPAKRLTAQEALRHPWLNEESTSEPSV